MLWLAIVLPELPLQVFMRAASAELPLAVSDASASRILAVNPTARAAGVSIGQRVAAAVSMAPGLQVQARAPEREEATLAEVACWTGRFTPRIRLAPPDALLLEIGASLRLFGGAQRIEDEILDLLAASGLQARIASAPTALAAHWFAQAADQAASHHPQANSTGWQSRLDALPIGMLAYGSDCPAEVLELLAGLGIVTLGEARALPAGGLARRQAGMVHAALARARGEVADPGSWFQPPSGFSHELVLPVPATSIEPLLFASRRLLNSLAAWLQSEQAAVDHCRFLLQHDKHHDTVLELVFGAPCRDPARLWLIARERLAATSLPAPVCALRLQSDAPQPFVPSSEDLFGGRESQLEEAGLLLDRLRARLGADAIEQVQASPDHRPEAASKHRRSTASAPSEDAAFPAAGNTVAQRPFWLLAQAQQVCAETLRLLTEPERIESGWWDGAPIRRDYHLAEHEEGFLCWVYRDLDRPQHWFVHGYFG